MENIITARDIRAYCQWLNFLEKAKGTIAKYRRDMKEFAAYMGEKTVTEEAAAEWKTELNAKGCSPKTINAKLAAINGFFRFMGWGIKLKFLKIQKQLFREEKRQMSREEYSRLLRQAEKSGQERLALLMETLGATGIRVGELKYITAEGARKGKITIALKGKIRTILLPERLCRKLTDYANRHGITGEIFVTASGKSLSRRQIWHEMKRLCRRAGIEESKVYPHSFRHLFATVFYAACKDIVRLADVLGHSSVETTRIYIAISCEEHRRMIERLGLVI